MSSDKGLFELLSEGDNPDPKHEEEREAGNKPVQFSSAVAAHIKKTREALLNELFDASSTAAHRGIIAEHLAHGKGDFHTSAPQLQDASDHKLATLQERVEEVLKR